MVIYMIHPQHGNKVACSEQEAQADEKRGWKRYELAAKTVAVVAPAASVNALASDPDERTTLAAKYAEKFGKPPHPNKGLDRIRKELAA